jgi:hypothetical protein
MRFIIELCLEIRKIGAARPGAVRASGLRHEPIDHAMEGDAIIKALSRK